MKKRKGFTLIETLISLVILSLAITLMLKLTGVGISQTMGVTRQYSVVSADSFIYDIYRDYHKANQMLVSGDDGDALITFVFDDGSTNSYQYVKSSGDCMKNGTPMFKARSVSFTGTGYSLVVSIKLQDEKLMTMTMYK